MRLFHSWAWALGLAVVGFASTAQAGFYGDTMSVSLTVHTTGAADQVVWSGALVTPPGPPLLGDSDPGAPGDILGWSLDFDTGGSFVLSVDNPGPATETIEPLLFALTGIDGFGDLTNLSVVIGGINTLGIDPGDISVGPDSISISSATLSSIGPGGTLAVQLVVVPEASTVAMMSLVATGVAGYVIRRRRRNG